MNTRRSLSALTLAALLLVGAPGCSSLSHPTTIMGGTRAWVDVASSQAGPHMGGLQLLMLPLAVIDFLPSLAMDVALLPLSSLSTAVVAVHEGTTGPKAQVRTQEQARRLNELNAITQLREIAEAQRGFKRGDYDFDGRPNYAPTLAALQIASERGGYRFEMKRSAWVPQCHWMATGAPVEPGVTGTLSYAVDESGTVYVSEVPFAIGSASSVPEGAKAVD